MEEEVACLAVRLLVEIIFVRFEEEVYRQQEHYEKKERLNQIQKEIQTRRIARRFARLKEFYNERKQIFLHEQLSRQLNYRRMCKFIWR